MLSQLPETSIEKEKTMASAVNGAAAAADTASVLQQKRGQKNFHPFCLLVHKPTPEEWVQEAKDWLIDCATISFSRCRTKAGQTMKCSCFNVLEDESIAESVAEYLYFFGATCSPHEKDRIMMDFVRLQDDVRPPIHYESYRHYRFPYIVSPEEDGDVLIKEKLRSHYVCISALQHLLGYGRKKMKRIRTDINNGLIIPARPRIGKANRKDLEKEGILDELHLFFEDLSELEEPRATRLVREATGVSIRDSSVIDLPPYMTKRGLYRQFCYERGVVVSTTHKGTPIYTDRNDSAWLEQGCERLKVPTWSTFVGFWKKEYPSLRIQKPIKDICGECYRFSINNRKKWMHSSDGAGDGDGNGDDDSLESEIEEELAVEIEADDMSNDLDTSDANNPLEVEEAADKTSAPNNVRVDVNPREAAILEASIHINDAIAQRKFVAQMHLLAKNGQKNNLPPSERTFLFFFDYAQNVECPFFGQEQPGETYYFSPLSINLFGITDACGEEETLHSYCYHEGQGKKGGNNVTSMLHHYLHKHLRIPVIRYDESAGAWGGHLVLVCDNCGGQNKNRMVTRYLLWLIECKVFRKVSLVFLIAGHTKNPCDRLFNLLKKGYRQRNIFDVDGLITILDENKFCTAEKPLGFHDWDKYLESLYARPKSIKKWHIFEVEAGKFNRDANGGMTRMQLRRSASKDATTATQQCIKPIDNRANILSEWYTFLEKIEPPGIRAIKKREMWQKFRPVVPEQYHGLDIYQRPTDEELEDLKKQRANKAKEKKKVKEAAASYTAEERKRKRDDEAAAASTSGQPLSV